MRKIRTSQQDQSHEGRRPSGKRRTSNDTSSDTDAPSTFSWEEYLKIEELAFRCAEQDTRQGQVLDPHTMTPEQVKKLTPSKSSARKLVKLLDGKPPRAISQAFQGAYKQRLVELLKDGQAAAGMCVEKDCREAVKELGNHQFRRCPGHVAGGLRRLGREHSPGQTKK